MKKVSFKMTIIALVSTVILTSCGVKNTNVSNAEVDKLSDRTTIEKTIKSYYSSEVLKNNDFLSEYFLNSKMSGIANVKKMLTAYKVKRLEIIKLYNVKTHGNYAVMTCAYNTYFQGVDGARPDIEIVALSKKNGYWYIINDYSNITTDDMKWLTDTATTEKQLVTENSELLVLLKKNQDFNNSNKAFIDNGQKELEKMTTNSYS